MKPNKIKEVFLGNEKIKIEKYTEIFDANWRDLLKEDGLYCLRAHNDLLVYRLGNFIFDLEKNKNQIDLHFRERHEIT